MLALGLLCTLQRKALLFSGMCEGVTMRSLGKGRNRGNPFAESGAARRVTTSYLFHSEGDGKSRLLLASTAGRRPSKS
jgi:hypothetical protein